VIVQKVGARGTGSVERILAAQPAGFGGRTVASPATTVLRRHLGPGDHASAGSGRERPRDLIGSRTEPGGPARRKTQPDPSLRGRRRLSPGRGVRPGYTRQHGGAPLYEPSRYQQGHRLRTPHQRIGEVGIGRCLRGSKTVTHGYSPRHDRPARRPTSTARRRRGNRQRERGVGTLLARLPTIFRHHSASTGLTTPKQPQVACTCK